MELTDPEQYSPHERLPFEDGLNHALNTCSNYRDQQEQNRERIERIPLLKMRGVERRGDFDEGFFQHNGALGFLFPESLPGQAGSVSGIN